VSPARVELPLPVVGVDQVAAVPLVAVMTWPVEGVPVTVTPSMEEPPPVGVAQSAAVLLVAVRTWPVLGVPDTVMPLIFATVGLTADPLKSPAMMTLVDRSVVRLVMLLSTRVVFSHLLVAVLYTSA
jgi:hypothetical protein